jgi:hypothetical protein
MAATALRDAILDLYLDVKIRSNEEVGIFLKGTSIAE